MTMFIKIPGEELAKLEADARIYPYVSVLEFVQRLREAYAEIDRLMGAGEAARDTAV